MDCKLIVVFLGLVAVASCYHYVHWNPCHPNPCGDPQARCHRTGNGLHDYKCICPAGKKFDPLTFECAGPCSHHPCGSARCVPYGSSSYRCKCPSGKYYDKINQYCRGPCDNFPCGYVKCQPTGPNSHKCVCPRGEKYDIYHHNCRPIPNTNTGGGFGDSNVLANQGAGIRKNLKNILNQLKSGGSWKKCFTASENSFLAASFHRHCDNKGPTVVIARVGNRVFGGYTPIPFNAAKNKYLRTKEAAIFQVNKNWVVRSTKRPLQAIYSGKLGPLFGAGPDLYLPDKCNVGNKAFSNLGLAFQTSSPYLYSSNAAKTLLAGKYKFNVNDYEAYYWVKN